MIPGSAHPSSEDSNPRFFWNILSSPLKHRTWFFSVHFSNSCGACCAGRACPYQQKRFQAPKAWRGVRFWGVWRRIERHTYFSKAWSRMIIWFCEQTWWSSCRIFSGHPQSWIGLYNFLVFCYNSKIIRISQQKKMGTAKGWPWNLYKGWTCLE